MSKDFFKCPNNHLTRVIHHPITSFPCKECGEKAIPWGEHDDGATPLAREAHRVLFGLKPRVLLTGAAGRLGQMLLRANLPFDFVPTDILTDGIDITTNLVDLVKIATGTEAVVHLAGNHRVDAPWDALQPNIMGVYNVFEAAKIAGCSKVVFASSAHADDPSTLYGATKLAGEALANVFAKTSEMSIVCLRLGWVGESALSEERFVSLVVASLKWPGKGCRILDNDGLFPGHGL
jgi:hypothetical protein